MSLKVVSIQIMNHIPSTLRCQFMGRNNRIKIGRLLSMIRLLSKLSVTFHDYVGSRRPVKLYLALMHELCNQSSPSDIPEPVIIADRVSGETLLGKYRSETHLHRVIPKGRMDHGKLRLSTLHITSRLGETGHWTLHSSIKY